jgi:hypothetical protein
VRELLLKRSAGHVTTKEVQINKFTATKSSKEWLCQKRSEAVESRTDPNNGAAFKTTERRNSSPLVTKTNVDMFDKCNDHIWTETTNNFLIRQRVVHANLRKIDSLSFSTFICDYRRR